ncbi:condensation domain-containing protein, partial [Streptomyces globisporus]|uniref:condensation domain-containing protein n=1 Tax=Streptomyces globisporus TaxID=1908 RepID=UPI0036B812F9
MTAAEVEGELRAFADAERARRFDLDRPPLLRMALIRHRDGRGVADRSRLVITQHHVLVDGWSAPLMVRELLALYDAKGDDSGLPSVTPYREYLVWLSEQDRDGAREAWTTALAGAEPTLLSAPPVAAASDGNAPVPALPERFITHVPQETTAMLQAQARRLGVTLSTLVQCVWGVLIGRMTGQDDVVFGAVVSGRTPEVPGVESMIGLFINTVPVRVRMDAGDT